MRPRRIPVGSSDQPTRPFRCPPDCDHVARGRSRHASRALPRAAPERRRQLPARVGGTRATRTQLLRRPSGRVVPFAEAEALAPPTSGTSRTTTRRFSSRRSRCRPTGRSSRSADSSSSTSSCASTTAQAWRRCANGTTRTFRVAAINGVGADNQSAGSNPVTPTTIVYRSSSVGQTRRQQGLGDT